MNFIQYRLRIFSDYPIISLILMMNLLFFIFTAFPLLPNRLFFEKMAGVNIFIADGEFWRLITPIFIHGSVAHLLFNSFALFLFGSILEPVLKKIPFLILYITAGVGGNLLSYLLGPLTLVHYGSSGSVFGLIGAVACLLYFNKLPSQQAKPLGIIIFLAIIFSFMQKEVNVFSHIGGFSWGIIQTYSFIHNRKI